MIGLGVQDAQVSLCVYMLHVVHRYYYSNNTHTYL